MGEDLKNALNRTWLNYLAGFGMIWFIERTLEKNNLKNVLYAAGATILSAGHIKNGKMYSYSENQNIRGLLIITNQCVLHFSKGKRIEIMSLDDTKIEIKKHLFTHFIHLHAVIGFSYMNIGAMFPKEIETASSLIEKSIKEQRELLKPKIKRRKNEK
jgi:hypothetical protein